MPKRYVEYFMTDLLIAIDKVKRYSKNQKDPNELISNEKNFDAIIRELEIIGEAIRHILKFKELKGIVKSEWRIIVDFRNVITHEYFGIDPEEVYKVVKKDIIVLEKEVKELIIRISAREKLIETIDCAISDLNKINHIKSVRYLKNIRKQIL
jgi:uncharacterized protein with HEPN domain